MGNFLKKITDMFYFVKLEIVIIGIENSGKSTLLN